jgi:hypothetical protein
LYQPTKMSTDTTHSRAGSLPQLFCVAPEIEQAPTQVAGPAMVTSV